MAVYTIYIKNMVCPRCIMAVKAIMNDCNIAPLSISLGEVQVEHELTPEKRAELSKQLKNVGFELLTDPRQQMVEQIRSCVIDWVAITFNRPKLSVYMQEHLNKEYSSLSKLFSEVKGITIEQYMKLVRIERVKEELCYGEKSISELSYQFGFSSPAHLSAQFKSVTGMSPKQFQKLERPAADALRATLDKL